MHSIKAKKVSEEQKIIQGDNSIQQLSKELTGAGYNAIFLITGKHFRLNDHPGLFNGITVTHFIKSGPNVEVGEVQDVFADFSAEKGRAIVAIGGGSVMDLAKAVIHRSIDLSMSIPFFAAVPTTAGSGSEATYFAVIYKDKKKYSLVNQALLPQLVILDPSLTYSLSNYQTAVTGMDAFSQAVESFWNINATVASKQFATDSILLWKEFFLKTVDQATPEGREKMLQASHLAGKAINTTRTTGPHALSYYLTIHHHIPHGQAVALFLPVFFLYNQPVVELCALLNVNDGYSAMQMIRETMKEAGLAIDLAGLGISKENIIDKLLDEVNEERFANNPVAFDREKLKQLILEYL